MERGVYFDAWFPRQHCYHPSLPPRRLKMVDDLVDYRATTLVWSALGGGSLSLPYLEQEAYGDIDPRFRFYGFVNDAEFIAECRRRGIKVFGIVFEAQGWEFAAEVSEGEDRVLALNELRGEGVPAWLGLREFGQNRYPKLWKPVERYGLPATDFIEECVCRDIHGAPLHARWVEVPDNPHECYLMDRNNPVWREYLKAVIRTQIDAGVDGIQLDEAETPLTAMQYGGCFCRTCMTGFAEYLGRDGFHYGEWLLEQGHEGLAPDTPLYWDYVRFQSGQITRYFGELADYARSYAASRGREVLVSGNFFNSLAAYVFAKRRFPGRDVIFLLFLATMMVPPTVTLIPNYIILKHIPLFGGNDIWGIGGHGMLDSYYGLILPSAVSAFGIFLLRQYMQTIPDELLDAARIDGASEFKIFWGVVLPLCRPALAAMFIFTFTYAWEDFLWPLIITSNPDLYTAPLGLALFVTRNRTSWDMLMAGSVIATLPMVLVFMIFQRQFIRGISLSGLKG